MDRRSIALLVTALAIGGLFLSPVGAHVTSDLSHLWNGEGHIKDKVKNLGDARWAGGRHNHNRSYPRFGVTGNFLPPGRTASGAIAGRFYADPLVVLSPISYGGQKLRFEPIVEIRPANPATASTNCPGGPSNPLSRPGYLCVYTGHEAGAINDSWAGVWDVVDGTDCGCTRGAVAYAFSNNAGAEIAGTWSVTAPLGAPTARVHNEPPMKGTGARH
jgi:hypothetical protein